MSAADQQYWVETQQQMECAPLQWPVAPAEVAAQLETPPRRPTPQVSAGGDYLQFPSLLSQ